MEKVCEESAVKISPIPLFNFGKQPIQPMHARKFEK